MCLSNNESVVRAVGKSNTHHHALDHSDLASTRLPTHIVPLKYSLSLYCQLEQWSFQGYTAIHLDVKETTKFINFHSLELAYRGIAIYPGHVQSRCRDQSSEVSRPPPAAAVASHTLFEENQRCLIELEEEITPGPYTLELQFTGEINDHMMGLYRSIYVDADGNERRQAVTQFEATDARRCIPCWDEPACKAEFECTVICAAELSVLSNMPTADAVTLTQDADGWFGLPTAAQPVLPPSAAAPTPINDAISFATPAPLPAGVVAHCFDASPRMSTYLLAFALGYFESIETTNEHGVLVRVFTPPGKTEEGRFALDLAARSLDFFLDMFACEYPIAKCDLLAIADLACSGMENWSLILFRETKVLVTSNTSSASLLATARVICHEMSHQIMGNLVTMEWWDALYLNEAFARLCEFLCLDALYPEWRMWQWFVADPYTLALVRDGVPSSHAIETRADTPDEINAMFDAISYAKGAALLRMLRGYLGDAFSAGMRAYVRRHSYANATSGDLWRALQDAWAAAPVPADMHLQWDGHSQDGADSAQPTVPALAHAWVATPNYPVLFVARVPEDDAPADSVLYRLRQRPVTAVTAQPGDAAAEDARLWPVILTAQELPADATTAEAQSQPTYTVLFNTASTDWRAPTSEAMVFNAQCHCLCRVVYEGGLPAELKDAIRNGAVSAADRLGVLGDAVFALQAGLSSLREFLDILSLYAHETSLPVLCALAQAVKILLAVHRSHPSIGVLKAKLRDVFAPLYTAVGGWAFDADAQDDKLSSSVDVGLCTSTMQSTLQRRGEVVSLMLALGHSGALHTGAEIALALLADNSALVAAYAHEYGVDAPCVCGDICACFPCKCALKEHTQPRMPQSGVWVRPTLTFGRLPADLQVPALDVLAHYSNHYDMVVGSDPGAAHADKMPRGNACDSDACKGNAGARRGKGMRVPAVTVLKAFAAGAGTTEVQLKVLSAAACLPHESALHAAVAFINSAAVRMQDQPYVLAGIALQSAAGHHAVWQSVRDDWAGFYARYKAGNVVALSPFLSALMMRVGEAPVREELAAFFTDPAHACPEGADGVKRGLEALARTAIIEARQAPEIEAYCAGQNE